VGWPSVLARRLDNRRGLSVLSPSRRASGAPPTLTLALMACGIALHSSRPHARLCLRRPMSIALRNKFITPIVLGAAVFCATVGPALADQLAWIPVEGEFEDLYKSAKSFLEAGKPIYSYCAPCKDKVARKEVVATVVETTPAKGYKALKVNGKQIDLAYIYVPQGKRLVNLASAAGFKGVEGVPVFLPQEVQDTLAN
jgi:hypothetical protein